MSKKVSFIPKKVSQIEEVLYLFTDYCPTGLACFFGDTEFPDIEELAAMISARYTQSEDVGPVDGGKETPIQQSIVETADNITDVIKSVGGLEAIQKVFILYEAEMPDNAKLLQEMNYIGRSFRYTSIENFVFKHHMSLSQFYRKKKMALRQLTWEIYRSHQTWNLKA
ncbi:MAG: hypothetical protein RR501_10295 [Cloacibacillus sp.]